MSIKIVKDHPRYEVVFFYEDDELPSRWEIVEWKEGRGKIIAMFYDEKQAREKLAMLLNQMTP